MVARHVSVSFSSSHSKSGGYVAITFYLKIQFQKGGAMENGHQLTTDPYANCKQRNRDGIACPNEMCIL